MNKFLIDVSDELEEKLADIYYQNPALQNRIAKAQHRIETLLAIRPETAGVYRAEGLYCIDDFPLRIHYTIHSILSEVEILEIDIWLS